MRTVRGRMEILHKGRMEFGNRPNILNIAQPHLVSALKPRHTCSVEILGL
jgi:hypothetical protein